MRACAPFMLDTPRDPAWRWVVIGLVATAAAGLTAWLWRAADLSDGPVAVATAVAIVSLLIAAPAAAVAEIRLRWDGERWWLASPPGAAERPGRLRVMLDLSVMMLLRFDADADAGTGGARSDGRRSVQWIALRRRCLASSWPALRRTVYSAPPFPGGMSSGDGPRTETTRPD